MRLDHQKLPRLYCDNALHDGGDLPLNHDHYHYLFHVMRKNDGDHIRVFNGCDGEYLGVLRQTSKKIATLTQLDRIKPQPKNGSSIHLYFAPIRKERMAFLIEKAVELGVTHFHPMATHHTQHSKINPDKMQKQMIEAAEQCERMDIPHLSPLQSLNQIDFVPSSYAAIERYDMPLFNPECHDNSIGLIIGPEGGWSHDEITFLNKHEHIHATSLGERILRAETAALFMLSRIL